MTRPTTKIILVVSIALAATTVIAFEIESHKSNSWRSPDMNAAALERMPPQVAIVPTDFPAGTSHRLRGKNQKVVELGVSISNIVAAAYGDSPTRTVFDVVMPSGRYDFICTLPKEALQQELKKQFGLVGHRESRETDALLLRVKYPNASGLKPSKNSHGGHSLNGGQGHVSGVNINSENLANFLERQMNASVIDQTGFGAKSFDFSLEWNSPDELKQTVLDQLGLELVQTNMPVEMLVIERTK